MFLIWSRCQAQGSAPNLNRASIQAALGSMGGKVAKVSAGSTPGRPSVRGPPDLSRQSQVGKLLMEMEDAWMTGSPRPAPMVS